MQNLMIDLETLGTDPSAPIIEIGACFFDLHTGEISNTFNRTVRFESACELRAPDASTIKWWMTQSDDARKKVASGKDEMFGVLFEFISWVDAHSSRSSTKPWGNGSTFDISMLENCMKQYNIEIPWEFWNHRDVRTVLDIAGFDKSTIAFDGVPHSALDDAKHQVKYLSAAVRSIRG